MRLTAVLVCSMLVLAGCSTLIGGSGYPPGTNATHVNETALLAGHQAALDNRSFTSTWVSSSNASRYTDQQWILRVGEGGETFWSRSTLGNRTHEFYGNSSRYYLRIVDPNGVDYRVIDPDPEGPDADWPFDQTGLQFLIQQPPINYTLDHRKTQLFGPTVFVYRDEGYEEIGPVPNPPDTHINVKFRVTGDGLVRSYDHRALWGSEWVNTSMRVTDVGSTTVTEPEWLDDARANTSTGSGDRTTPE